MGRCRGKWYCLAALAIGVTGAALNALMASPAAAADAGTGCGDVDLGLPAGFCATRFAELERAPRHMVVSSAGVVYANLTDGQLMALRDRDHDGVADQQKKFGHGGGTGIVIDNGWLYAATMTAVRRYRLGHGLLPTGEAQTIVTGMPQQSGHRARGLAVDDQNHLYIGVGAPSNACQKHDRQRGSPGLSPCPLLKRHGGIWQFRADQTGQQFSLDQRFATGARNVLALAFVAAHSQLYGAMMGRDELHDNWPEHYTQKQSAHLPAEQFFAIDAGDDLGWPYCYHNPKQHRQVLSPEYGGDGRKVGRCDSVSNPVATYPAHWSPMDILAYHGSAFPARYSHGVFIAFHGSWNRAPFPQAGFRVVFQPLDNNGPAGPYQTFVQPEPLTNHKRLRSPRQADHRPAGLAEGPDGALYLADDAGGVIYRIRYISSSND